ncbi:hypothetical protein ACEPAG_4817 [Sanghuangporus baumii]
MRSPQTWCTEEKLEHLNLSDLTIKDDAKASSGDSLPSSPLTNPGKALGELMNKLPPEVLAEIFYWCTPTADDQDSCHPHAALTLGQVCKHWRSITLISPQLWTYTKVRVMQSALEPALKMMGLYLERSKSLPVFIDVDFIDLFSYYQPVLGLFERIVCRARECRPPETLSDSFLATHLEASSTEERPTREEWYFWSARPALPQVPDANDLSGSYTALANTPVAPQAVESLVTIRALRVATGSFVLEPYLPWASSLTFLILRDLHDFTNLSISEAARILSSFPLLVHCSLHIDFDSADANTLAVDSVDLRFLKSFSLSWADWINTGRLLDTMSARELRELELVGRLPDTDTGGEWDHLVHFLRRNNPPLSHIILEQIDCFHTAFLSSIALTPGLEGLWLEDCLLDETIIRGLVPLLSGTLKTLVLIDCYAFNIEELARVLKDSERHREVKVKVYVDACGEISPAHIQMIQEMELDNLEIGPSSIPVDMDEGDTVEHILDFIDAI